MAEIELIYNELKTTIKCIENDKFEDIANKFCEKENINKNYICFIYEDHIIENNKTFKDLANSEDKKRKIMSIIVIDDKNAIFKNQKLKKSKYIICPKCQESIRIEIKDFKIKLFGCKNGHIINDLSFFDFNRTQLS